jgi:hypothetical protein
MPVRRFGEEIETCAKPTEAGALDSCCGTVDPRYSGFGVGSQPNRSTFDLHLSDLELGTRETGKLGR